MFVFGREGLERTFKMAPTHRHGLGYHVCFGRSIQGSGGQSLETVGMKLASLILDMMVHVPLFLLLLVI